VPAVWCRRSGAGGLVPAVWCRRYGHGVAEQRSVVVTGTGVASGTPDQCRISVALNHMAESAADALAGTAERATTAIAALGDVRAEQCEARTVGLSLQDFFDKAQQTVTARIGSYQLELVVRPIDAAGAVLAVVSAAVGDALQIRGLTLGVADPEPLKSEARRLAVRDARRRATELAQEAGLRLGAVVSVSDQAPGPVTTGFRATAMAATASGVPNVPIEAGTVSASSVVTLVYAIED